MEIKAVPKSSTFSNDLIMLHTNTALFQEFCCNIFTKGEKVDNFAKFSIANVYWNITPSKNYWVFLLPFFLQPIYSGKQLLTDTFWTNYL